MCSSSSHHSWECISDCRPTVGRNRCTLDGFGVLLLAVLHGIRQATLTEVEVVAPGSRGLLFTPKGIAMHTELPVSLAGFAWAFYYYYYYY